MTEAKLVLTHGTTDLQILLRDDRNRLWRAVPDKSIVRRFHQWLLAHQSEAEIVSLPTVLQGRDCEATFTDFDQDKFALWLGEECSCSDAQSERNAQGSMQLVLPKIEPALSAWMQGEKKQAEHSHADSPMAAALSRAGVNTTRLQGVLVLSTDRGNDGEFGEQEPVATYSFLKTWLERQWSVPASAIQEEIFLHPGEKVENREGPVAGPIAERIERVMRNFYSATQEPLTLLIGNMGGMPQIKPLLAEIAVLLAGEYAENLFKTELGAAGLVSLSPIDAVRIRRECLAQVRDGRLLEAWIMASPFHQDPDARLWVRPLEESANLINGNPVGEAARLPTLRKILQYADKANCLLVAIRVETALHSQRWLEAINGTITFHEAAFRDGIQIWADEHLEEYRPRERYMRFRDEPPAILKDKKAIDGWRGKNAAPLAYQANMVGNEALAAWSEVLDIKPLSDLRAALYDWQSLGNRGNGFRLADYRNFNTHGVMTQDEIDEALKRFMGTNLWSQGVDNPNAGPKPGKAFLNRPLVRDVIEHFIGETIDPAVVFQELLIGLERQLIKPEPLLP